jgi:hypothetical protein
MYIPKQNKSHSKLSTNRGLLEKFLKGILPQNSRKSDLELAAYSASQAGGRMGVTFTHWFTVLFLYLKMPKNGGADENVL